MPYRSNLNYLYDGSFDGLLCCVFESYNKNELPHDITTEAASQLTFIPTKEIMTDCQKSKRVLASIPAKMGPDALHFVRQAFLTCLPQKELHILFFLRKGYQYGPAVMRMLTDEAVAPLIKAVKHLNNESHLLKGFLRFSDYNGTLVTEAEPKNYVLPLLTAHFCQRYPEDRFVIYDKTHEMALIYHPYQSVIMGLETLLLPGPDEQEQSFRALWRTFYDTIEVPGRHNPTCRRSHMPKRYWKYMTEFGSSQRSLPDPP